MMKLFGKVVATATAPFTLMASTIVCLTALTLTFVAGYKTANNDMASFVLDRLLLDQSKQEQTQETNLIEFLNPFDQE